MKGEKYGIGTMHINKNGEQFEIIDKVGYYKRMIKFKDRLQYIGEVKIEAIKIGSVRNPNYPSIFGIGYIGEKYDTSHPLYSVWENILAICYYEKSVCYKSYGAKGVTVHKDWHCFSNFVDDILYSEKVKGGELLEQMRIVKNYDGIKFEIDKDISDKNLYTIDTIRVITKYIYDLVKKIMKDEFKIELFSIKNYDIYSEIKYKDDTRRYIPLLVTKTMLQFIKLRDIKYQTVKMLIVMF